MESLRLILFGLLLLGNDAVILNTNSSPTSVTSINTSTLVHLSASAPQLSTIATSTILTPSLISLSSSSAVSSASSTSIKRKIRAETFTGPYLDGQEVTNVTTQIGIHAYLPCKVKQNGSNKSVSWIRVRDDHILSVDRVTFIADERFQSFFIEEDGLWTLQIKYVQARDEGTYECQVSTEPKVSARVHLKVIVPKTEIVGDAERYVKAGSTVILRCVVRGALEPPSFIIWYHGVQQIFAENRNGWRLQIDRGLPGIDGDTHSTIGSLLIASVKKKDAGNYTCSPSNSDPVTVSLHVINGEYLASAITSSASQEEYRNLIIFSLLMLATFQT